MDSFKIGLIENLIKWLITPSSYTMIKAMVIGMMDSDKTGEEKRIAVQDLVKPVLTGVAGFLINLAIESAVTSLKTQLEGKTEDEQRIILARHR